MKWIGQNIYDQISRFRNDVHVTGDLTVTGDNIIFQSANADDPLVTIKNTSNAANDMARLNFVKERDSGTAAANDNCAEIRFLSKDASGNEQQYGLMLSEIDVATHGQESGRLKLGVASHDGENSYGLQITGGSVDNEVDVLLGTGDASETTITGTLTMGSTATIDNSGAWVGGVIPSAKLDADTAHLSGLQTFTDPKFFGMSASFVGTSGSKILVDGNSSVTPGDGAAIHIDAFDVTDASTSASGTTATYTHVNIEPPRLTATNSSVTTTDAATLYIKGAPTGATNQTISNAYALWVNNGNIRLDGMGNRVGTITSGTWNGTAISTAYIGDDQVTEDKLADTLLAEIDANTAKVTNSDQSKSDIDGLAITTVGTLDTGNATAIVDAASLTTAGKVELATTDEADTGTDATRAVTPAGLKSHVATRYAYQYINFSLDARNIIQDVWRSPGLYGITEVSWTNNHGAGQTQAASDAPSAVDIETTISVDYLDQSTGLIIPKACKLDGFYGNVRVNGNNPNTIRPVIGFFRAPEPADSNTADVTATCVAFDSYDTTSGNIRNRFLKLENSGLDTNLAQGDILFPAVGFDATGNDAAGDINGAFTLVLKTLIE